MNKQKTIQIGLIILSVILRLAPHLPNFTPIGAAGLFAGTYFGKKSSLIIVLLIMLISDYLLLYVNPYAPNPINLSRIYSPLAILHSTMLFVYSSLTINVLIGWQIHRNNTHQMILAGSLLASIQFFIVTNFGVWVMGAYARDFSGLLQSYLMGLPFFKWTLLGDLSYTLAFFGCLEFSKLLMREKSLAKD